jgi:hypothetical protein
MGIMRFAVLMVFALAANAAEIQAPERVTAGTEVKLTTTGSGEATFYLAGPAQAIKRKVRLGESITLKPEEVQTAGRYIASLRDSDSISKAEFWVAAATPATINFLARPSRVPTSARDAISGVAFVFDKYNNLVLAPTTVKFDLAVAGAPAQSRGVQTKYGIAWTRMDAGRKEGAAQFTASVGGATVRRVVQEVAADPCNLRMRAAPSKNGILLETEPVRDCSGNPVPDGTIVTFTSVNQQGKTTVDARVKRGVARTELPPTDRASISVASGVVVGNEIHWGGGR